MMDIDDALKFIRYNEHEDVGVERITLLIEACDILAAEVIRLRNKLNIKPQRIYGV